MGESKKSKESLSNSQSERAGQPSMLEITTDNGKINCYRGIDAARKSIDDLFDYFAKLSAGDAGTFSDGTPSTTDRISAGASVISAITGVASLMSAKSSEIETFGIDIYNYSSYPVCYSRIYTPNRGKLIKAPRPIMSSESTSFEVIAKESFVGGQSQSTPVFMIGNDAAVVKVILLFAYMSSSQGWYLTRINIDDFGHDIVNDSSNVESLMHGITFEGTNGYPSFSVYTSNIGTETGKSYIMFCDR